MVSIQELNELAQYLIAHQKKREAVHDFSAGMSFQIAIDAIGNLAMRKEQEEAMRQIAEKEQSKNKSAQEIIKEFSQKGEQQ